MGVQISGLSNLKRKLDSLPKYMNTAVRNATYELTDSIQGEAQANLQSSIKYSSGELAGSVKTEVTTDNEGNIVGHVWSDKKQAIFREFGTGKVGQHSNKELPPGVSPIYTQTVWFFPVGSTSDNLTQLYGIPTINIQGKAFYRTGGQPAHPWLYPALKNVSEYSDEVYAKHFRNELRKAIR